MIWMSFNWNTNISSSTFNFDVSAGLCAFSFMFVHSRTLEYIANISPPFSCRNFILVKLWAPVKGIHRIHDTRRILIKIGLTIGPVPVCQCKECYVKSGTYVVRFSRHQTWYRKGKERIKKLKIKAWLRKFYEWKRVFFSFFIFIFSYIFQLWWILFSPNRNECVDVLYMKWWWLWWWERGGGGWHLKYRRLVHDYLQYTKLSA